MTERHVSDKYAYVLTNGESRGRREEHSKLVQKPAFRVLLAHEVDHDP